MSEGASFTEAERAVLTQYGVTMLQVQGFEWSLKRLATLYTDAGDDPPFEVAKQRIEKILRLTAGGLIQQLEKRNGVPEDLLAELENATKLRNDLAHEYLFSYVLQKSWGADRNPQDAIAYLQSQVRYFASLNAELYPLIREREQAVGVDRILASDMGKLIEEVIQENMREGKSEEA
jgi:hypothetical protein